MLKTLFATILLSTSLSTPTLKADVIQPRNAVNTSDIFYGSYNYRESFDDLFEYIIDENISGDFVFELGASDSSATSCPINYVSTLGSGYLMRLIFSVSLNGQYSEVEIEYYYNTLIATPLTTHLIEYGDTLQDLTYPETIFCNYNSVGLGGTFGKLFNLIYTHDDNSYTTTYNGYYSFLSNSQLTRNSIFVTGNTVFNGGLFLGFDNYYYQAEGTKDLLFNYYDSSNDNYSVVYYSYPFTENGVSISGSIMLSNAKMTQSTYTYLNRIGVFAYVRDTSYDNATFNDLLFSLMDSPIYMITRLLSFEFFGVNLFVAFTGLLTIVVILILIRRFF